MEISKTAAGVLVAACVTAGAGGAYLAVRPSSDAAGEARQVVIPDPPAVTESETILDARPAPPLPERHVTRETTHQARPAVTAPPQAARVPAPKPPSPSVAPVVAQDQHTPVAIEPPVITDNHASRSVDPPAPVYEELVVSADSVIGLQLESPVTSERAQVEDQVFAHVTRDVRVGDRVAIPSGSRAQGEVTLVERGGKLRDRARLGVRFTSIVLADGTRLPIHTDTIFREGDPPGRESAAKIGGGAVGGAIIGGILGGAKGAAIGSSIGAGAGTAAIVASDRNHATLSAGSPLTVRLQDPVAVTVEK